MTIEKVDVDNLEKTSPHRCIGPYNAMKLLENFDSGHCWSERAYSEVRGAVASIARKFLMAYFMKHQDVVFLSKVEKQELIAKFDKIIGILKKNEDSFPEISS